MKNFQKLLSNLLEKFNIIIFMKMLKTKQNKVKAKSKKEIKKRKKSKRKMKIIIGIKSGRNNKNN